jgi:hypothetical protein
MKRLVVGVFVSALVVFGVAPSASAATSEEAGIVKVAKAKKIKPIKIDWDSAPVDGGFSTQRIDWD